MGFWKWITFFLIRTVEVGDVRRYPYPVSGKLTQIFWDWLFEAGGGPCAKSAPPFSKSFLRPVKFWGAYPKNVKGNFPQTTMWIGRVESNFTNLSVNVWADLDNPFKRNDYAKLCMSPSQDGTLPEYVISQEDNSPLTLYKYRIFKIFKFSWISIVLLIKFIHKYMHIHLSPNIHVPTCM